MSDEIKDYPPYLDCPKPKSVEEDYVNQLKKIIATLDTESAHVYADELLCEILLKHGYKDIVDIFNNMEKWYA